MLYDPKWETETKPDVFSLEGLLAWLQTKPPNDQYNYEDCCGGCLYGQYVIASGIPWKEVFGTAIYDHKDAAALPFKQFVYHKVAKAEPHTFGAALKRARKYAGQS